MGDWRCWRKHIGDKVIRRMKSFIVEVVKGDENVSIYRERRWKDRLT